MQHPGSNVRQTEVHILPHSVTLNGVRLDESGPPNVFHEILGVPDRIQDPVPEPAPFGHRHNQVHYYDAIGITLGEHHYTRKIDHLKFVFDLQEAPHPTVMPFQGLFDLNGYPIVAGSLERELERTRLPFVPQRWGAWSLEVSAKEAGHAISVWVSTCGHKLRSGRRSKRKHIVYISLGLKHDPWDDIYADVKRSEYERFKRKWPIAPDS